MDIKVPGELDGITIKEWLTKNGFSRGLVTRLKRFPDGICVNGEHATVRRILREGDSLSVKCEDCYEDENEYLVPTPMNLEIIYEDGEMIAVNKPWDMATHPSIGHFDDTLANGLAHYFSSRGIPFVFRAVNRLDRDTSGVVLVAKSRMAAAKLSRLMREGKIKKTYIALLGGELTPRDGCISVPIRRKDTSVILREVCGEDAEGAKTAVTEYRTLRVGKNASVVSASPITGRTHQLRVHFAHMGAPIIGDGFYGSAERCPTEYDRLINRQALHAHSLTVELDDGSVTVTAPIPEDMEKVRRYIEGV